MNPLASISDQALRGVKGVFTDIDDTLIAFEAAVHRIAQ